MSVGRASQVRVRRHRRRLADGKTPMEAMRCLRRRLSDVVYRQLAADFARRALEQAGPGGHSGATLKSSAADLTRSSALRTRHLDCLPVRRE